MFEQVVGATCPVRTLVCLSSEEARVGESQIRAYKLGKQRWSYNQYELLLMLEDTHSPSKQSLPLSVTQAVLIKESETEASCNVQADSQPGPSSSKVSYRAQLSDGTHVITSFYLVYPEPSSTLAQESCDTAAQTTEYSWTLVTRDNCKKSCKGPLLRPLRRLGVLGSRFNGPGAKKADSNGKQHKQSKYMYFAIDEACTHVGSKAFRLIVAVHDDTGSKLLGTTCSQPIRVVANNDIPQGAAHIVLVATIRCCSDESTALERLRHKPCSLCRALGCRCCVLTSKQQKPKCNTDMHRLYTHCSYVPSIGLVPDICRGDWADQQPSSPRRPNVCLWPNSRLKQTSSDTQGDVSVCYSTGLEPTATGACCPKAAELPLQLGTCTADDSSTNTRKDQLPAVTGIAESSRSGHEGLHCTGPQTEPQLGNLNDPFIEPDFQTAQQEGEGAQQYSAEKEAEFSEMANQEHEASFDPPDTLLWQLESEPLPPSPVAQWDKIPMKLHSGIQPFNCYESFGGEHSGLRHPSPGPVVNPEWDLKGQTCKDNVPVHHPSSELPSSQHWSSHQHSSTYGDPDDSHSQSMLETTGNSLKRGRCTHAVADCASGLLSGLMPSDSAPQYLSSPWRKCMRRGFLFPAATSYLEHVGSASGTCASEERQASVRSMMGTCIAQLEDQLETRTSELRQQRAVTSVLDAQLVSNQQEIQWLRYRVCQLQHGQCIRKSFAARRYTC